jgi:hypothetical protein
MVLPVLAGLLMKRATTLIAVLLLTLTTLPTSAGGGKQVFYVVISVEGARATPDTAALAIRSWRDWTWHGYDGTISYNPDDHVYRFQPNTYGNAPPWGGAATLDAATKRLYFATRVNGQRVMYVLEPQRGWQRLCPIWPLC